MNSLRLATWAVFLTAALDIAAWIATESFGLQAASEVGRGLASLFMGGLLAVLGWLILRGNKLALVLAIGLAVFDVMAGACLSTGTDRLGGIGDVLRAVLVFLMLPGVGSLRASGKSAQSAEGHTAERPERRESSIQDLAAREQERGAVDRGRSREVADDTKPPDPVRRRLRRAIGGLLALLACGLSFAIWETLFHCDPRQPWDMQLGCVIRPDPTPDPFPVEGVRQLTFDATYYEELKWSPAGDYLLAVRCEVIQREAECYAGRQPVLIDLVTGAVDDLDFSWYATTASRIDFRSYVWSTDGREVLLDFTEVFTVNPESSAAPNPPVPRESVWRRVALDMATKEYAEIDTGGIIPIVWLDEQATVFGYQYGEYDQEARHSIATFGWYSYKENQWQEEMKLRSDYFGKTLAMSPDLRTLLLGRDLSNSSCRGQVLVYEIGNQDRGFTDIRGICFPAFSSGGTKLAFSQISEADIWPHGVWIAEADGSNPQPVYIVEEPESTSSISWSPDGSQIAFTYGYQLNAIYIIDVPGNLRP